jgi:tetratricopeptide (TPR) repeat protein
VGNYPQAIAAAQRQAEAAVKNLTDDPEHADQHRQDALNACLLLHESTKAAGKPEEAIRALEMGGALIDRERDPLLWADYHEVLAEYYLEHASYDRASGLIDEITDIREDHQEEQPALAKSLLLWARLLFEKADYAGAVSVAARAERIFAQQSPPALDGILAALSSRGIALIRLGDFGRAEPLMRRALAIAEQAFGPDHPDVARDLNNLAQVLQETNRLAEAEPLMARVAAIFEKALGPDHPHVATALNNLAGLLLATNRLAEAEPLYRRALAIDEHAFGPDHPTVAIRLNNLARLLGATDRLAEAEPLSRRSVVIFLDFTSRTGHEHPHLRATLANYWGFLEALGRSEAEIQAELDQLLVEGP